MRYATKRSKTSGDESLGQDESFGRVAKFAKAALEKMTELLIPQNPRNFTIWYHYVRGDVPELNGTLDHLIERGRAFTPEKTKNSSGAFSLVAKAMRR